MNRPISIKQLVEMLWDFDNDSFHEYGLGMIDKVVVSKNNGKKYRIIKQLNPNLYEAVSIDGDGFHQLILVENLTRGDFYQESA